MRKTDSDGDRGRDRERTKKQERDSTHNPTSFVSCMVRPDWFSDTAEGPSRLQQDIAIVGERCIESEREK